MPGLSPKSHFLGWHAGFESNIALHEAIELNATLKLHAVINLSAAIKSLTEFNQLYRCLKVCMGIEADREERSKVSASMVIKPLRA